MLHGILRTDKRATELFEFSLAWFFKACWKMIDRTFRPYRFPYRGKMWFSSSPHLLTHLKFEDMSFKVPFLGAVYRVGKPKCTTRFSNTTVAIVLENLFLVEKAYTYLLKCSVMYKDSSKGSDLSSNRHSVHKDSMGLVLTSKQNTSKSVSSQLIYKRLKSCSCAVIEQASLIQHMKLRMRVKDKLKE